jgi:predicted nucleotidyltransferase
MVRISRNLKQINIDEKLKELAELCKNNSEVLACLLYGSYGTEYQTPLSDVDLAMLLMPNAKWDIDKKLQVDSIISNQLREEDVNIVVLNEVSIELQYEILLTGRMVFVRDPVLFADFKEYVIKYYLDYKIDMDKFYEDYEAVLLEGQASDSQK